MSKTPYLIHRRQTEQLSALPISVVTGRRFLFGPAAVLAALTLSALPLLASDEGKVAPATQSSAGKPLVQGAGESWLTLGKSLRFDLRPGFPYQVQDGSVAARIERGDGYILVTPLETGRVALTLNGIPHAVRVVASAQTSPSGSASGVPVAASAGGTTAPTAPPTPTVRAPLASSNAVPASTALIEKSTPTLVPVAPEGGAESLPLANSGNALPALEPSPAITYPRNGGVPSGMAPLPSPPRVSPSLPPPARTPGRAPFPTRAGLPQNLPSGVPIKVINVNKGLASLLSFQRNILSVYFSDATVMDARAINARTLAVTGVLPGKSTLAVFTATPGDDAVGQLHMFHIVVEHAASNAPLPTVEEPETVELAVRSAINDPRIQVTALRLGAGGLAIRLTGRVREEVERKAAEETAALYAARVINGIVVTKDALSYDQAFLPDTNPLTPEEIAQNQLRLVTGNQTIELSTLGGSWVLKGEVGSQAEAQQLMALAGSLNQRILPLLVVRGPGGASPVEQPISTAEDREMTRRLQEVTALASVYAIRTASNGIAVYGTVRNRLEFDRVQRYKDILPVVLQQSNAQQAGQSQVTSTATALGLRLPDNDVPTVTHPTNAYKSTTNIQMFVRIEDAGEAAMRLVTIDTNVVEISRNSLKNLGVEFGSAQLLSQSVTPGTPGTVVVAPDGTRTTTGATPSLTTRTINSTFQPGSILGGNGFIGSGGFGIIDPFRTRLNALYQNGNANILSKPNVTTLEGTEAQITIGGARPIPIIQSGGGGAGTVQEQIIFRRFGVILTLRPTVLADDTIILQIRVDVTDLDQATGITRGNTFIPGETVRSVNNVLVLKEGDIIALGGLISNIRRQQVSKVPFLSKIPILGALFQSKRFENNETELAIFLTPSLKRVSVNPDLTENVLHPNSWPKLTGIDENQSFNLSSVSGGAGGGGGGGG